MSLVRRAARATRAEVVACSAAISIRGKNFGATPYPLSIAVAGLTCTQATWLNDGLITCVTAKDIVGT